ncbi:hypothetical protein [Vibrio mediterranei]|jgi:hypothetical protein|uniref:Lipoprotein n=1 Tax=Vibrio mediterranei TaxID=689 RepID=A0A2S9ZKM3_9VIBR|nr:hypothetical protein [Vibrio mediterranei]AYV19982.1 hypothetical protein ECB94_01120 [Vibrio mediterranei]NUW72632.1 hypothetical protein [Vibrio mediterranei]PCD86914.1 hypothetical protein COR52_18525 [Vibrio mediterranei]PRQ66314.1 hypothetical protein COR51_18175 [Vibrio mediterranei]
MNISINTSIWLLPLLLLLGCSERYYNGKGAEYLVYPETHVYEFTARDKVEATKKLAQIFDTIDDIDTGPTYVIEYKNNTAKSILKDSMKDLKYLPYRADAFSMTKNGALSSDIKVIVTFHNLAKAKCKPIEIETQNSSRNCFSEAARVQQVAHKERLVEGI